MGSSTACLASLEKNGVMKTTNLGDSGYLIIRVEEENLSIK